MGAVGGTKSMCVVGSRHLPCLRNGVSSPSPHFGTHTASLFCGVFHLRSLLCLFYIWELPLTSSHLETFTSAPEGPSRPWFKVGLCLCVPVFSRIYWASECWLLACSMNMALCYDKHGSRKPFFWSCSLCIPAYADFSDLGFHAADKVSFDLSDLHKR